MNPFLYKNNRLFCEGVSMENLAERFGTPLYVYSYGALAEGFKEYNTAFSGQDHLICYSMKANSNRAVLKTFLKAGGGIDVVTGGELKRALNAGCPAERIVFSGVGKTAGEIEAALRAGILQFNVESEQELDTVEQVAQKIGRRAPIALRVNPDVDPKTHHYIATGLKKSKFGIEHERAVELYRGAAKSPHLDLTGIHCHIGSQLTSVKPFVEAVKKTVGVVKELEAMGIRLNNLDIGGGLGITYRNEKPPAPRQYAAAVRQAMKGVNLRLILEPGRFLVGNAGVLLTRVISTKKGTLKNFVVTDAASNDLMRPSLYGAYHEISPVAPKKGKKLKVDVVGPICETGDFLAQDRLLPPMACGDLVAILSAGAYGFSMSSTYNSRPRAAEVMVRGDEAFLIRERETAEDLVRGEKVPGFLS